MPANDSALDSTAEASFERARLYRRAEQVELNGGALASFDQKGGSDAAFFVFSIGPCASEQRDRLYPTHSFTNC